MNQQLLHRCFEENRQICGGCVDTGRGCYEASPDRCTHCFVKPHLTQLTIVSENLIQCIKRGLISVNDAICKYQGYVECLHDMDLLDDTEYTKHSHEFAQSAFKQ